MSLSPLTQATRWAAVLQVIRLMNQGRNQQQACEEVGISTDTFQRLRDQEPEGLMAFQELITSQTREMIAELLSQRVNILHKIVQDGLNPETKPADRLAIFRLAQDELDKLAREARLDTLDNQAAEEVLGGPVLTQATSRFSITHDGQSTTIKIESPPPILDLRARDTDPEACSTDTPGDGPSAPEE